MTENESSENAVNDWKTGNDFYDRIEQFVRVLKLQLFESEIIFNQQLNTKRLTQNREFHALVRSKLSTDDLQEKIVYQLLLLHELKLFLEEVDNPMKPIPQNILNVMIDVLGFVRNKVTQASALKS